jgi:dolichol-phosphate mannosyltransferase
VISKENSGHGPTILHGYRLAVDQAEWVFQTDSDDEMSPVHFARLWGERQQYSALFGYRAGRQQDFGRRLISAVSRQAVHLLFGPGIKDVNTPYRLMRSDVLGKIVAAIPADTFAPNILISGVLAASGLPVLNLPVAHEGRKSGVVSIVKWHLWKAAARSLFQTLVFSAKGIKIKKEVRDNA